MSGVTTALVREARERHDLAPTASAAVGRLVTAAALLGASVQGRERISLRVVGDGPIGSLTADAWRAGPQAIAARAYARNGYADLPLNARGKFDVAGVVGSGNLQVTKSFEIGQPYNGIVPLASGEIGDDVAAYLANSEQIPSVVAVGVLADPAGIRAAGGVINSVTRSGSNELHGDFYFYDRESKWNAYNNFNADVDELKVTRVEVDPAPMFKRFHARAKGRGSRVVKRNSHITIQVGDGRKD